MTSIIVLVIGEQERVEAERALAGIAGVRFCDRVDSLRELAAGDDLRVVVSVLRDGAGAPVAPALAELQRRVPAPTLLLWIPVTNAAAGGLLAATQGGVYARVVLRDVDDLGSAVRDALARTGEPLPENSILERIAPHVPSSLNAFFTVCATKAAARLDVTRAAHLCGTPPRTLEDHLRRAGLPPAWQIVGWCRVLHAVWRLDVLDRRTKQVVAELGFPSYGALSNLIARYCQCTPGTVRDNGGYPAMLDRFVESLREGRRVSEEDHELDRG